MVPFNTVPILGLGGHSVKLRFGFTSGSSPTAENGIWLDDLQISCYAPTSAPLQYDFLQGTSMAAPHVTGVIGLAFALNSTASYQQVRAAVLDGVDVNESLSGITVTGGRLNARRTLAILKPSTVNVSGDIGGTATNDTIIARLNSSNPAILEVLVNNVIRYSGAIAGVSSLSLNGLLGV